MGEGFNMFATEVAPRVPKRYKRLNQAAILLSCAGLLVITGAFAGMIKSAAITKQGAGDHSWGMSIYVLLGMILVAIALSSAALTRPTPEESSNDPAQGGTRRFWLILLELILIQGSVALLL
jgi:hypothetical protein